MKTTILLLLLSTCCFGQTGTGPTDPPVCNPILTPYGVAAPLFYNTTSGQLKACLTANTWTVINSGSGAAAAWGSITGTLSSQTDLQTALNSKESVLTFNSPLSRTGNTVACPTCTGGGSGAPGGTNLQVQFNDSGVFGGSSLFTFDKTTGHVGIGGPPDVASGYWLKFTGSGAGDTQWIKFAPASLGTTSYIGFSNKPVLFQQFDSIGSTVAFGSSQNSGHLFSAGNTTGTVFAIRPNGYFNPSAGNTPNLSAWGEPAAVATSITHWLSGASRAGTDVNTAGAPAFLMAGPGTGSGGGGDLHIQRVPPGTAGTGRDVAADALTIVSKAKALTNNVLTNVCDVPVASGAAIGVTITYTINATDGTDYQSLNATYHFSAVNKAGTITLSSGSLIGSEEVAPSTGTLSSGPSVTAGSGAVHFNLTPASSLTTTSLSVYYRVSFDGAAGVVSPF